MFNTHLCLKVDHISLHLVVGLIEVVDLFVELLDVLIIVKNLTLKKDKISQERRSRVQYSHFYSKVYIPLSADLSFSSLLSVEFSLFISLSNSLSEDLFQG